MLYHLSHWGRPYHRLFQLLANIAWPKHLSLPHCSVKSYNYQQVGWLSGLPTVHIFKRPGLFGVVHSTMPLIVHFRIMFCAIKCHTWMILCCLKYSVVNVNSQIARNMSATQLINPKGKFLAKYYFSGEGMRHTLYGYYTRSKTILLVGYGWGIHFYGYNTRNKTIL